VVKHLIIGALCLLPSCALFRGIEDPVVAIADSGAEETSAETSLADTSLEDTGSIEDSATPDTASDTAACSEGAVTCAGASLQKCVGGKLTLVEECATAELCAASGMGPCKAPVCAVGEKRCAGKVVEKCNAGRTGFASDATCDLGCESGACLTLLGVSAGGAHTCAALSNGTVRCWGKNSDGQLGDGTKDPKASPTEVPGLKNVVQVAAGYEHTCARLADGTLRCWGSNFYDQIGDGGMSTAARPTPVAVYGLGGATDVALGTSMSCALMTDATVRCWGQYVISTTPSVLQGVRRTPHTLALTDVTQISVGSYHACALKKDGSVWCWWGNNQSGEHADGSANPSESPVKSLFAGVKQVAAGNRFTCALLTDGTVKCAGNVFDDATKAYGSTPVAIVGITGGASIVAREQGVCVQLTAGGMRCWGYNEFGQLADGTKIDRAAPVDASAISAILAGRRPAMGWYHTMLFDTTSAFGIGLNDIGQIGDGKAAGEYTAPVRVIW
jgi:alpha-tubulin suppressor-like RCC1 family protein